MRSVSTILPIKEVGAGRPRQNIRRIDPAHSRVRPPMMVLESAIADNSLSVLRVLIIADYLIGAHLLRVGRLLLDGLDVELLAVDDGGLVGAGGGLHAAGHEPLVHALAHALGAGGFLALVLEGGELLLLLLESFLLGNLLGGSDEVDWRVFLILLLLLHEEGPAHLAVISGLVGAGQVRRI